MVQEEVGGLGARWFGERQRGRPRRARRAERPGPALGHRGASRPASRCPGASPTRPRPSWATTPCCAPPATRWRSRASSCPSTPSSAARAPPSPSCAASRRRAERRARARRPHDRLPPRQRRGPGRRRRAPGGARPGARVEVTEEHRAARTAPSSAASRASTAPTASTRAPRDRLGADVLDRALGDAGRRRDLVVRHRRARTWRGWGRPCSASGRATPSSPTRPARRSTSARSRPPCAATARWRPPSCAVAIPGRTPMTTDAERRAPMKGTTITLQRRSLDDRRRRARRAAGRDGGGPARGRGLRGGRPRHRAARRHAGPPRRRRRRRVGRAGPEADAEAALALIAETVTDYEGDALEAAMAQLADDPRRSARSTPTTTSPTRTPERTARRTSTRATRRRGALPRGPRGGAA
jgi:hypothetical protein